ncbi:Ochratoxin A non-ribosomal peptide synthetase [Colletotrichum higginsianum IMI 349063]|uniref:Ochratoxin A non-ribosomal peptide synthetase n=2 Tax=Colletotrichum higginsianum TaxID=80884 RepID=A0A1B7YW13_COLHI|nr:Ochratoxin A non-ribosomal peptide synthetase [Colletotrichum higginsianum IMI 349063]OBR16236.1 Ochratoxin A non-ribosomal peptide synthetase [Colletotrichum higginsianum IMI 349063]TID04242.1 Non-canonical non-ribosomal peptide synthetase FUB8 [Colletotrichum higginsianum]GJC91514.1 ochratoxin A non-ribosomal peptide synthetase [Colletotrichum higginsianum]
MTRQMDKRLITHVLDDAVKQEPDRVWASYAISTDIARHGFRDVTIGQLARAVDRLAWRIEAAIGKSTTFETVLYYGLPDVRYAVFLMAAVKTGHKVLFCSHFNSLAFNLSLCERTDCGAVLRSEGVDGPVDALLRVRPMREALVPTLDDLFNDNSAESLRPYPYNRSYAEGMDDPVVVGHTSGTTGLPKPVAWTQRSFAVVGVWQSVPDLDGRPSAEKLLLESRRCYQTMPIYHPFGLLTSIIHPLHRGGTLVLGPNSLGPITPPTLEQMFEHADFDSLAGVPVYLEMIARSPSMLDVVGEKLRFIYFAGGALSPSTGNALSARVRLHSLYGSTEAGAAFGHLVDRDDWEWLCLNDDESGLSWEPYAVEGVEGVHELTFVRTPRSEAFQHVFWHTDCGDAFRTNDLFVKHPTKRHHWRFYARKDDMVVTKFGWNVNPVIVERTVAQHPAVRHVVVGGTGRRNICAVVDLVDRDNDDAAAPADAVLENIWPSVEKSNAFMDKTGQLARERILFSDKDRPFPLAGKGNVQRAAVLRLYEREIDDMYARVGDD